MHMTRVAFTVACVDCTVEQLRILVVRSARDVGSIVIQIEDHATSNVAPWNAVSI